MDNGRCPTGVCALELGEDEWCAQMPKCTDVFSEMEVLFMLYQNSQGPKEKAKQPSFTFRQQKFQLSPRGLRFYFWIPGRSEWKSSEAEHTPLDLFTWALPPHPHTAAH